MVRAKPSPSQTREAEDVRVHTYVRTQPDELGTHSNIIVVTGSNDTLRYS